MRAARLIKMVLLLQGRPSMTAAELARELEVSERTVTRDAQALSEAGVPVYADRGRAGGYRLIGGYRTRLTGLGRSEAEALFLSGVPGALREMGLEDAASAARLKVSAALLPSLRDASRTASQRFHLDAPSWFKEPKTPELLPAVADAVWDDRRIVARYRRGDTEVERELEPYGLVLKAGIWYLCARVPSANSGPAHSSAPAATSNSGPAHSPGSFRTYRIDRFTTVDDDGTDRARFTRDEEFDLPAYWDEQAERFARSILHAEVVLRLSAEGVRRLPYVVDPVSARDALTPAAEAPDEHGRVTVTLRVESEEVAHTQLTALGPEVEVLAPDGLRARFAGDALRLAGLYADRQGATRSGRAPRDPCPNPCPNPCRNITIHLPPRASHPPRHDAGPVMDETEFWELVDTAREDAEGDPEDHADLLVERLGRLDPEAVLDFARHFESRYNRAYTWDLWGAASVLLDGVSDDAFDFFRCWLIGQGREVFEGAVHDPDSLADLLDDFDEEIDGDGEELGYAADEAYEQLTGVVAPDLGIPPPPGEPEGTPLDFENESALAERYPKLWERFRP